MTFVFDFPAGWYALVALAFVLWLAFWKISRTKLKMNLIMGVLVVIISAVFEILGIALGLWNYTGGNWPAIIWPGYFIFGMAVYAMFKTAERRMK